MRQAIEAVIGNHAIYTARKEAYKTEQKIPFRVSPTPLELSRTQREMILSIGSDLAQYFTTIDGLYRSDGQVRQILDRGKPEIYLSERPSDYLFIRPDMIITPKGFSISEIETSPFGLGLAEMLNRAYRLSGQETIVSDTALSSYVTAHAPIDGTILYSNKTVQYAGQLTFLADTVFSSETRHWQARHIAGEPDDESKTLYRGFYLSEYNTDPAVSSLMTSYVWDSNKRILPSPTPHLEEKAVLAFLWDKRFEVHLRKELGDASVNQLRSVVPPTWIVGQEAFFAPGLPANSTTSIDLAGLSRAKRTFVLKSSGFNHDSSWAEGVHFLHTQSADNTKKLLAQATADTRTLHVVQEFTRGQKTMMFYEDDGEEIPMSARVRLTPYFGLKAGDAGKLIAMKATGCENTDFIHASSISINTAVK